MDLLWEFVFGQHKFVSRLADKRRGLKEGPNQGFKDKGKGGQGQQGDSKKKLLYRIVVNTAQANAKSPPNHPHFYVRYVPGCENKIKHTRSKM